YLIYKKQTAVTFKDNWRKYFLIGGLFFPLVVGRVLSGSFGHQYDALLVICAASVALVFLPGAKISNKFLVASFALFFILSISKFDKVAKTMLAQRTDCAEE